MHVVIATVRQGKVIGKQRPEHPCLPTGTSELGSTERESYMQGFTMASVWCPA